MKLWLLEVLVQLQGNFTASPPRRKEVRLSRLWPLVALAGCVEVAVALGVMGAIRPLSSLF